MANNVVVSRVKPQLVRKHAIVHLPSTVKIVVQPSKSRATSLQQIKHVKIRSGRASAQAKLPTPPANAAISQKKNIRRNLRRKTQIKYITADLTPQSIARINSLRLTGLGKILLIIGNGPSLAEVELQKLRGVPHIDTMSINQPDERLWPTDHWCFFDGSQMRRHENIWTTYEGNIFNSTAIKKQKSTSAQIKNLQGRGFSRDLSKGVYIGRSSVYAAMQIAMWLGYEHVYIFGCDMNPDGLNGKLHFYGVNPDVEPGIRKNRFKDEASHYSHAATILTPDERQKYTFCTDYNPWDFIKQFQQLSHKSSVEHILLHAKRL